MFIETLEFTIPVDLCDLFSTLKRGPKSNMEFPASVNSYGTTQDANIQVVLRSNKLTFKVDGVSSDASMISKSECKNLKLSIFDVDRSLMPQEEVYDELPAMVETPIPSKRAREYSAPVRSPPVKSSRTSYSDSPRNATSNRQQNLNNSHQSNQSQSRPSNDNSLNVKQEPEDPDCIEIEPDPEPDIVPKKESSYYSSCSGDIPHTQTSQSALERLSHPHSSHSQSPASSSSSFHQNVPHVQDYSEPGPSQLQHGDQSADDFLVFQEQDDNEDCDNDNEADFDNDDSKTLRVQPYGIPFGASIETSRDFPPPVFSSRSPPEIETPIFFGQLEGSTARRIPGKLNHTCGICGKTFSDPRSVRRHRKAVHDHVTYPCVCGKSYKYAGDLHRHHRSSKSCKALMFSSAT